MSSRKEEVLQLLNEKEEKVSGRRCRRIASNGQSKR